MQMTACSLFGLLLCAGSKDGDMVKLLKDRLKDKNAFISGQTGYVYNIGKNSCILAEKTPRNNRISMKMVREVTSSSRFKMVRIVKPNRYPMVFLEHVAYQSSSGVTGVSSRVFGLNEKNAPEISLNKYSKHSPETMSIYPEMASQGRLVFRMYIGSKCVGVSYKNLLVSEHCKFVGESSGHKSQLWMWIPNATFRRETDDKKTPVDYLELDEKEDAEIEKNSVCTPCPVFSGPATTRLSGTPDSCFNLSRRFVIQEDISGYRNSNISRGQPNV
ncbi:uncharacterized protein NEMAJ01_0186 [Nematocida major]|uniref:uncharacterized protein n=1 Tax=Nematocida major TaxID=1912982 RepID=UPI00200878FF|nr:uncharacterized protein NEMAJ01_0186 [Nematocida major]KAH9385290.1 hypothetical protein NEMAJ01_0186 [Nematocida major]